VGLQRFAAGHTWYPNSFLAPMERNEPWLSSALELVASIIEKLADEDVAHTKVAILGFSQGACLATEFVARNPIRYGGLVAFTGGLIGPPGTVFRHSGDLGARAVSLVRATQTRMFLGGELKNRRPSCPR
jgi:phospholipase/carboxylesterase